MQLNRLLSEKKSIIRQKQLMSLVVLEGPIMCEMFRTIVARAVVFIRQFSRPQSSRQTREEVETQQSRTENGRGLHF